jgi:ABC-type transport system involved in cytochrome c biogenesis permease subunit
MPRNVKKMNEDMDCCRDGKMPFVAIPSAMAGIFLVITVLFLIFANSQLGLLVPIVWAFVVLGIVALLVAARAMRK